LARTSLWGNLVWGSLECRLERSHDKILACVHARGRAGESVEIDAVPVAHLELEWGVLIEAERQGDTPIGIVVAALTEVAPLMADIAAKLRREIPDLVKRPLVTEFEDIIGAGLAEIFRRPGYRLSM
jgi:hypothetical protein